MESSLNLAYGMGKRVFFSPLTLHSLCGESSGQDYSGVQSKQQLGKGTDQFKNRTEMGMDQSEDFLVKNALLPHFPSPPVKLSQCVTAVSGLGIMRQQQAESV